MDVSLGNTADRRLKNLKFNFRMLEFAKFLTNRFDRTANVGANNDVKGLLRFRRVNAVEETLKRDVRRSAGKLDLMGALGALLRDL